MPDQVIDLLDSLEAGYTQITGKQSYSDIKYLEEKSLVYSWKY